MRGARRENDTQGALEMASGTTTRSLFYLADLAHEYDESRWYAAHTRANHEKRLAEQLAERSVEHFLPLYACVRRWKDRRVTVQLPLFPGYILVRLPLRERMRVLQIPGVARLVGFNGSPAPLPDAEIEALREKLNRQVRAEPHPYLQAGRRVRVRTGPLEGFEGILVRRKHKYRIVVSIDLIMRSIAAEVDLADVEPAR
jgi:transcription antitermination factor NusG